VKLTRVALGSVVAFSLLGTGLMASSAYAQDDGYGGGRGGGGGSENCVTISGGTVSNETVIDLSADAGTAISDASAGSYNEAVTSGRRDAINTASAGNGGVATAAANGGAISLGDINSGGNAGNAISVGDTYCNAAAPYEEVVYAAEAPAEAPAAAEVVALPSTGVGVGDPSSLFALLASAGAGMAAFRLRRR
jgi:hypothetical protein